MVEFRIEANGEMTAYVRQVAGQPFDEVVELSRLARQIVLGLNCPQPEQGALDPATETRP
jgi:hypothetical protein